MRAARCKVGDAVRQLSNACGALERGNPGGAEWVMAHAVSWDALRIACDLYETLDDAIESLHREAPCSR